MKITNIFLILLFCSLSAFAQTTEFNYQGTLKDNAAPANANYDFEFALFDAISGGNQIGVTIPKNAVTVTNGVFAVKLDFGNQFPGANRYLEIRVKLTGQPTLTPLAPRQLVNSAPYSVKTLNADNATNATNAVNATTATSAGTATNALSLGGTAANQFVQTNDSRLTDSRNPLPGSLNYIQSTTSPQTLAFFNITGNGIVGGNFGVGTSTPQTKLQVLTPSGGYGFTHTDGTVTVGSYIGISSSGPTGGWFGTKSNHKLYFFTNNGQPTMTLDTNGRVGINTVTPNARLEVSGDSGGTAIFGSTATGFAAISGSADSGNGVTGSTLSGIGVTGFANNRGSLAIRGVGTSWFSGDTTPLDAGNTNFQTGIAIGSVPSANFGYIFAVDYTTFTSQVLALNHPGGRVGIGTTTPDQTLSVNGNASKAGGGSWATYSDERLKNIKGRFTGGLKAVMKLQPLIYEYKKDNALGIRSEGEHVGFSAQAVEKIIPEAVTKNEQGYRLVNNDPILWTMLNAIKEQQVAIEKLSAQVRQLQRTSSHRIPRRGRK